MAVGPRFLDIVLGAAERDWERFGLSQVAEVLNRTKIRVPHAIFNKKRAADIADGIWRVLDFGLKERHWGLITASWGCLTNCGGSWYDSPPEYACLLNNIRSPSHVFNVMADTFRQADDPVKCWEIQVWVLMGAGYFVPDAMVVYGYDPPPSSPSPPSRRFIESMCLAAEWLAANVKDSSLAASRIEDEWMGIGVRDVGALSVEALAEVSAAADREWLRRAVGGEISSLAVNGNVTVVDTPYHRISFDRSSMRTQAVRRNGSLSVTIRAENPTTNWMSAGHWFTEVQGNGVRVFADNFATIQLTKNVITTYYSVLAAAALGQTLAAEGVLRRVPNGVLVTQT